MMKPERCQKQIAKQIEGSIEPQSVQVFHGITGAQLQEIRKARRLSQTELANQAGIGRQAVSYWENKPNVGRLDWAPVRMFEVLRIKVLSDISPLTRARGDGVLYPYGKLYERALVQLQESTARRAARLRIRCDAKTRKGRPCRLKSEPGRRRCKFHGGMSTGPRTTEGKARIAEAQRQRWARWRDQKADQTRINEQNGSSAA